MAGPKPKTVENCGDVDAFINGVENKTRREDAFAVKKIMGRVTGHPAMMWGTSIVGFGRYHYRYESGREGDLFRSGFSPRKQNLVLYLMPGYQDYSSYLARLGKHKTGKSCLYINKLSDIDISVLEELVTKAYGDLEEKYPQ